MALRPGPIAVTPPSPRRRRLAIVLFLMCPVALTSCMLNRQRSNGCGADKDCRHQRVCESGVCVWPPKELTNGHGHPAVHDAQVASTADVPMPTAGPTSTTMFRLGPEHRGRSPHRIPAREPQVAWSYETAGRVTSSPTLGPDGLVLVGSHDGHLYALSSAGELAWRHKTDDLVWSSPALDLGRGVVYVGSDDDHLHAVDLGTRQPLWRFRVGSCPQSVGVGAAASRCDVDAGPTIGPDGVIYTGGDAIYAINPDGSLRWRFPTGGHVSSAPALLPDGSVVAGSQDNLVYAVGPDGLKRWDFRTGDDVESSPAVAEDGTVYVGSDDGKVYALGRNGALQWAFNVGRDVRASPALAADGTVYVGAFDGLMYAIRRDGALAWTFRSGDRILSSALIDADGAILFGSQDDRVYALEPDGRLRWSVGVGGDVDSSPALAADGTIFVGSDDKKVYALRPRTP